MAGTNAQAAKLAIITALDALPSLDGVQVKYSMPRLGDFQRECIFGGKIDGTQRIAAGRSSGNTTRQDMAAILLHIRVTEPGNTVSDTEARALVLGAIVENYLAANTPAVTGLLDASVVGYELESFDDDESAVTILTLTIATESMLT